MEVDVRLSPGQTALEWELRLKKLLEVVVRERPRLSFEIVQVQYYPGFVLDKKTDFALVADRLVNLSGAGVSRMRYATNAGFYAEYEIPCCVFGPGSMRQAHTADEWVDLAEVHRAAELFEMLLLGS